MGKIFGAFLIYGILFTSQALAKVQKSSRIARYFDHRGTTLYLDNSALFPKNWHHQDFEQDTLLGISSNLIYSRTEIMTRNHPIIVAIIDAGIDVNHYALNNQIWINEEEIPNNGIDDDGNGYIDDVMGWNFLGNKAGMATFKTNTAGKFHLIRNTNAPQHNGDSLEITREYKSLLDKQLSEIPLTTIEKDRLVELQKIIIAARQRAIKLSESYGLDRDAFVKSIEVLAEFDITTQNLSLEKILEIKSDNQSINMAIKTLKNFLAYDINLEYINEQIAQYRMQYEHHFNPYDSSRRQLVDDDPSLIRESGYGNNDVIGSDPLHGTHIAGIIAAEHQKDIPVKGIAPHAKIMPIRAIPNGDERDKDIVNAIYYAVENGAKVINMSFGKHRSPHSQEVQAAIAYAETHEVLVIQAAGNEYKNIDQETSFPHPFYQKRRLKNFISVAASTPNLNSELIATFSNYGKERVDILAPGSFIYSTIPQQKYANMSGTSMAAPMVSGIAAFILGMAPELSVQVTKKLILEGSFQADQLEVYKPQLGMIPLRELIRVPGVVNLKKSIELLRDYQSYAFNAAEEFQ